MVKAGCYYNVTYKAAIKIWIYKVWAAILQTVTVTVTKQTELSNF